MPIDLSKIKQKINPKPDGQDVARMRTAIVDAVNTDGTIDILLSGIVVTQIPRLAGTTFVAGDTAQLISYRGSLLAIGVVAESAEARTSNRVQTTPRTSNSASIGLTETTVDSVTADLVNGRTYKVVWATRYATGTAGDTVFLRLRPDNSSGTQMQIGRGDSRLTNGGGSAWPMTIEAEYTAIATAPKTFVGTFQIASGAGSGQIIAGATLPTYLYVDYIRG